MKQMEEKMAENIKKIDQQTDQAYLSLNPNAKFRDSQTPNFMIENRAREDSTGGVFQNVHIQPEPVKSNILDELKIAMKSYDNSAE